MTTLTKPVKRETAVVLRGRPLVIEIHPAYLTLREKGRRHTVTLDYRTIRDLGYKILARQAEIEKREARKARRTR